MSDDDLIRRGDALDAIAAAIGKSGGNDEFGNMMQEVVLQNEDDQDAIAAFPAVTPGVRVKPLRYFFAEGNTVDEVREHARSHPLARQGDMKLVWVNKGDLYNHALNLPPQAAPIPTSNCVICGRLVDTREVSEGGDGHGCEYPEGWTCSSECAEKLHPDPDWMKAELEKQTSPEASDKRATMVFAVDLRKFPGNPLFADTPFGKPLKVSMGDALDDGTTAVPYHAPVRVCPICDIADCAKHRDQPQPVPDVARLVEAAKGLLRALDAIEASNAFAKPNEVRPIFWDNLDAGKYRVRAALAAMEGKP